jgi:hypothetical protein
VWSTSRFSPRTILFTIYTSPIAAIASLHNIRQQQYADDTQLYVALTSNNNLHSGTLYLENCLIDLSAWFCSNGLALNPDKSDAIIFGTHQRLSNLSHPNTININGTSVTLSTKVKLLGVTLDNHLTFNDHINTICSSSFYHLRSLRHIRSALTQDIAKTVGCAIIGAKLDYANSLLHGTSDTNINRLQRIQNALARVVLTSPSSSATLNLQSLHWLPVKYRIKHKLCTLTYRACSSTAPHYLSCLLSSYEPVRALRSSDCKLLRVPRSKLKLCD